MKTPKTKIVFGAPGTGKTTFIINSIKERLKNPDGRDFTYVTYTKTAGEDFKKRLMKEFALGEDEVKQMWVGTQHSICLRLIGMQGRVIEEQDRVTFCQKIKLDFTPAFAIQTDDIFTSGGGIDENLPIGNKAFALDQRCRANMRPPNNLEADEIFSGEYGLKQLESFMGDWKSYKQSIGKVDFTDMLERVVENKLIPPTKRGYFDEFQDYGTIQYAVYKLWRDAMEEVVIAGDDDQCIYGYSGATPDFMLQENGERIILNTNHRNCKEIYDFGLNLIEQNLNRVEKTVTCANTTTGKVERIDFWNDGIAGIKNYLKPNDRTFVLVRTNRQVREICDVFDGQLIIYSCLRHGTPWTPEFVALLNALRKITLFKNEKLTPDELHSLIKDLPQKDYIIRGKKQELMKKFDDISFVELQRLYLKGEAQETLNTSNIMVELATISEARIAAIKSKRQKTIAMSYLKQDFPILDPNYKIYLGTFHSSKGLEAETVILSDALPRRIIDSLVGKTTEEERRVYYVAITRARSHLILAYGLFDNTEPFIGDENDW